VTPSSLAASHTEKLVSVFYSHGDAQNDGEHLGLGGDIPFEPSSSDEPAHMLVARRRNAEHE
jgi:hypothetical protein